MAPTGFYSIIILTGLLFITALSGCDHDRTPVTLSSNAETIAFEEVWDTILRVYPATHDQIARWTPIKEHHRSMIESGSLSLAAAARGLFAGIGLSHFGVFSGNEDMNSLTGLDTGSGGHLGVTPVMIDNLWWVHRVAPASVADKAGIRPGDRIDSFEGIPLIIPDSGLPPALVMQIPGLFWGTPHTEVKLQTTGPSGTSRSFTLAYAPWEEGFSEKIGHMPSMPMDYQEVVVDGILVIRFNVWMPAVMAPLRRSVARASGFKGLIIDLRSNPGGMGFMASGVAGRLSDQPFSMGTMHLKDGTLHFAVTPQKDPFMGPIAILIDAFSASTSEIFALGMQEAGRARIFGSTSMGAALPSMVTRLPDGSLFQYAIATFESAKGTHIEGVGVAPDHPVTLCPLALAEGRDTVLDAALQWLLTD